MARGRLERQRFGAHLSVAGGLAEAFERGVETGCDCIQVFVKNQKQWSGKPLDGASIRAFRRAARKSGIRPVIAHAGYLINLGSDERQQWTRSINAVVDELERCEALGIRDLVVHPGAHMGRGIESGIRRIVAATDEIHHRAAGVNARVLLETTAGQGSSIGFEIGHLGRIIRSVAEPERLGVCLDTCHLFAAGYDLADPEAYARTIDLLAQEVTLVNIRCIHMNDSKADCGRRVDRHEHIGKGKIGMAGFRHVVNDPRLARVPKILETPKGTDGRGVDLDRVNLRRLRKLVATA